MYCNTVSIYIVPFHDNLLVTLWMTGGVYNMSECVNEVRRELGYELMNFGYW